MQLYRKRADGEFVPATEKDIRSAVGALNRAKVAPENRSGGRVWKKCSGKANCRCLKCYQKRGVDPRTLRAKSKVVTPTTKRPQQVVTPDNPPQSKPQQRPNLAVRSSFLRW